VCGPSLVRSERIDEQRQDVAFALYEILTRYVACNRERTSMRDSWLARWIMECKK
jgi:hypothetical protein